VSLLDRLRRDRPPPEVSGDLDPDDRLLAWAEPAGGGYLVAGRLGIRLPGGRLVPWHTIDKAVWRDNELTVTESAEVAPGVLEPLPPAVLQLADPRNVPEVVRSRVTKSVAYTSRHGLPGGGSVRIVARRVPRQDGLTWSMRFDPPGDRDDPAARAAADQLLADARANATPSD
jgi:hypothetical protein